MKGIHIERIYPCEQIFTAKIHFTIKPELIGRWYTKKYSTTAYANKPTSSSTSETTVWCYCKVDHEDDLIGCDNLQCPIQWFHVSCLQFEKVPKGKWYCPDCRFQFK